MVTLPVRPRPDERGQGLVEYALIFVLIVIVAVVALAMFGTTISGMLSSIGRQI